MTQARNEQGNTPFIIPSIIDSANTIEKKFLLLNANVAYDKLPEFTYLQSSNIPLILKAAIYYGWLDIIKYLIEVKKYSIVRNKSMIVRELAHQGHLQILEYFINELAVAHDPGLLHIAAKAGHLPIVKWLRNKLRFPFSVPIHDSDYHKNFLVWILRKGHWHIAQWLVSEENFKFEIEINPTRDLHSLGRHLSNPSVRMWQFLYDIYDKMSPKFNDIQAYYDWKKWLEEQYIHASNNTDDDIIKREITCEYEKICASTTKEFSLLSNFPNSLLKLIVDFVPPYEVFSSLHFTNKKFYKLINNPSFLNDKYQLYFGKHEKTIAYKDFAFAYTKHRNLNDPKYQIRHACLSNNVFDIQINFKILTSFFPSTEKYFYSVLIEKNLMYGIQQFSYTLLSLSDPSQKYEESFPIIMAARLKQFDVVKYFFKKDPTVINQGEESGQSALMWAAKHGYKDIVEFLIEKKANLQIKALIPPYTPLDYALMNRHLEIIPILIKEYNNLPKFAHEITHPMIWAVKEGHFDIVQVLYKFKKKFIFEKDELNRTPLIWAIIKNHEGIVEFLLEKSHELICNILGNGTLETPLDLAFSYSEDNIKKILGHYIYKYSQTLPDYILFKIKANFLEFKPTDQVSFFTRSSNYKPLYASLSEINSNTKNSLLVKIENMLEEICRVHNLLVESNSRSDNFLIGIVEDALTWLFGNKKFLIQHNDKTIELKVTPSYWQLLNTEEKVIECSKQSREAPRAFRILKPE